MRMLLAVSVLLALMAACDGKPSSSQKASEGLPAPKVIVEKEKPEKAEPLPPEVKIKLKRDGKDHYSWELSGSDADEILKINEKLRKKLGGEQQK